MKRMKSTIPIALLMIPFLSSTFILSSAKETEANQEPKVATAKKVAPIVDRWDIHWSPAKMKSFVVPFDQIHQGMSTQVGFNNKGLKAPYPKGNCLGIGFKDKNGKLSNGHLCNVHTENFQHLKSLLDTNDMEISKLDDTNLMVTDKRIPKKWFKDQPCISCYSLEERIILRSRFHEYFEESVLNKQLKASEWKVIEREDPSGALAQILPGKVIRFTDRAVVCDGKPEAPGIHRIWETDGKKLKVYVNKAGPNFEGLGFKLSMTKDRMTLVVSTEEAGYSSGSFEGKKTLLVLGKVAQ